MCVYAAFNVFIFVFVLLRMPELTGPQPRAAEGALLKGHFRPDDFEQHAAKLAA